MKTLKTILALVLAVILSGCATGTANVASPFSSPVIRDFNKELRATDLYKATKLQYKSDWLLIENKIADYEFELESQE